MIELTDKEKVVHDLALIHAREKYHERYPSIPAKDRIFSGGISELLTYYETAVMFIAPHVDEIMDAYLDDDKKPLIH